MEPCHGAKKGTEIASIPMERKEGAVRWFLLILQWRGFWVGKGGYLFIIAVL